MPGRLRDVTGKLLPTPMDVDEILRKVENLRFLGIYSLMLDIYFTDVYLD